MEHPNTVIALLWVSGVALTFVLLLPSPSLIDSDWGALPGWLPIPSWMPRWLAVAWYGQWQQDPSTGEWLRVESYNKKLNVIQYNVQNHREQRKKNEITYVQNRLAKDIYLVILSALFGFGGSLGFQEVNYYAAPAPNIGLFLFLKGIFFTLPALGIFGGSLGFCSLVMTRLAYATGGQHITGAKVLDPEPWGPNDFGPTSAATPPDHAAAVDLTYKPNV